MNRKNRKSSGVRKVFSFTLIQMLRSKSNVITMTILVLVFALAVPVASFFLGGDSATKVGGLSEIYTYVDTVENYIANGPDDFDTRYAIQYGYSIILLMICVFSASFIVRAIVEEKSSKLVETLMVSIKSDAMIFGKILAVMTYMLILVTVLAGTFGISYAITGIFRDVSFIGDVLQGLGISVSLLNLGPELILVLLISLILAFLIFSQISALAGAGCSTMEDVEGANMAGMLVILAGYMISMFTMPVGGHAITIFTSLCPAVSAFSAPIYFLMGDIGWGILLASWAVQIVFIMALRKLSGKVYDRLIIYKGKRLGIGEIFAMATGSQKGGRRTGKGEN